MQIFHAYFFRNLAKKNWGARIIWNKVGTALPPNKMIPSCIKELSANHMLSRQWLQDVIITRSRKKKKKLRIIIEEAEHIGNCAAGRKYDVKESYIRDWRKKQIATYREEK